ncbi:unnamed protein product [Sphagnum jensenii]|uniref:Uncharacterized protein n=1 Tax=Sphagnum jensenii TaxID=128206 RepID=A0ABP0WNI9_9BRYO
MKRVKERSRNEPAEVSRSSNSGPASASTYYAGCFGDAIKSMSQTLTAQHVTAGKRTLLYEYIGFYLLAIMKEY